MNKIVKILTEEKGASVVLVALSLMVIFGFAALVIDYGVVALERREMVTAADAGALAGARILLEENGDPAAKAAAIQAAENYAVSNGAQPSLVKAEVIDDYPYKGDTIQAIVVSAGHNEEFFFARALGSGFSDLDVTARGVASWGYVTSLSHNFLPLFIEEDQIPEEIPGFVSLHLRVEDSSSNWGIFSLTPSSDINDAIRGLPVVIDPPIQVWSGGLESVPSEYIYETKPGKMSSIIDALIKDTGKANHGRLYRNYLDPDVPLIGLIPIVEIISEKPNGRLDVVVRGFAPYEIQDVVVDPHGNGSVYATNLGPGKIRGIHHNVYDGTDFPDYRGSEHKGTIIGKLLDASNYYYVPTKTTNLSQTGMGLKYSFLIE